jgi:hypothetical protein
LYWGVTMSVPWWVYLMGVVMVGFGVALHMLPSFLARLEAEDKRRREAIMARKESESRDGE